MPQPDDGLEGLAPVKMRPPAGIMPNAQHQTFHGFMTGAPRSAMLATRSTRRRSGT
jgi:hypothetical protein